MSAAILWRLGDNGAQSASLTIWQRHWPKWWRICGKNTRSLPFSRPMMDAEALKRRESIFAACRYPLRRAEINDSWQDARLFETNVSGTINLLRAMDEVIVRG